VIFRHSIWFSTHRDIHPVGTHADGHDHIADRGDTVPLGKRVSIIRHAALHALQHYDVIQLWGDAYDLGPNDEHIAHHRSFCRQFFHRQPMIATARPYWHGDGGPHVYPHSGYAWAMTRQAFDWVGGLLAVLESLFQEIVIRMSQV